MTKVVGVRFRDTSKTYYFDPNGIECAKGQNLIVETAKGIEHGVAQTDIKDVEDEEVVAPLRPVKRIATEEDMRIIEQNREDERGILDVCSEMIKAHKLEMFLTSAEYSFDRSKIVIYFTAEGRVDFRELVKDLAAHFHCRIELRQIGVRDESRLLGGLGICGRPFCCSTFLDDFHSVTIKMAKDQGLPLAPGKISGTCGRLMCCLKYEQSTYEQLHKITPHKGSVVDCREGRGTVVDVSLLTGELKIQLDSAPEGLPVTVNRSEVRIVKNANHSAKKEKTVKE